MRGEGTLYLIKDTHFRQYVKVLGSTKRTYSLNVGVKQDIKAGCKIAEIFAKTIHTFLFLLV